MAGYRTLAWDLSPPWALPSLLGFEEIVPDQIVEQSGVGLLCTESIPGDTSAPALLGTLRDTWEAILLDLPTEHGDSLHFLAEVDAIVIVARCSRKDVLREVAQVLGTVTEVLGSSESPRRIKLLFTMAGRKLQDFERHLVAASRNFPVDVCPFCVPWDGDVVPASGDSPRPFLSRGARGYAELTMELLDHGR